jgi:hypothetical protein
MSKKEKPIKALIIDDKQDYCDSLAGEARSERILLISANNLEDGLEILRNDKSIEFVILDGKCFKDADQEKSGITSNNIPHQAERKIIELNTVQNREVGYCVLTGFVEDLKESFESIFKVFDKGQDKDELFQFIKTTVQNSPKNKIRKNYNKCFEPFKDQFIELKYEYLLFDLIECIEKSDYRKKNLNSIRDLLEAVYLGLMNINCIPKQLLNQNSKPDLALCTRYLEGTTTEDSNGIKHRFDSRKIEYYLRSSFRKLKEETNQYSHLNDEEMLKFPFLSNAYTILEILEWLPDFQTKYYN